MDAGSLETWNTGMTVGEYPAPGQPIPVSRPSVVAFVGRARRGPLHTPVTLSHPAEFLRIFGPPTAWSWLGQAVQQFFEHGGQRAVVVRVASAASAATLHLPAGEGRLILRARDPGRHEHLRVSVDHDRVEHDPLRFNLVIQRLSDEPPRRVIDQEIFRNLSVKPGDEDHVGDVLAASALLRLAGPCPAQRPERTVSSAPGGAVSYVDIRPDGHDGEDLCDYDLVGSASERTGLFALEGCDELSLLCLPPPAPGRDLGLTALVAAERFCRRHSMMLVVDPPQAWRDARDALAGVERPGFVSSHVVSYFPWLRRRGEGHGRLVPACGAIAGMLARKDAAAGIWRGLDSQTGQLRGTWMPAEDVSPEMARQLHQRGLNVLARAAGGAAVIRGDVTLAGSAARAPEWQSLTRTRLVLFVLETVARSTRWLVFEQNDPVLWARVRHQVSAFLEQLHEQGAFAGLAPAQAWFVKCDADTQSRDRGGLPQLNIVLGLALCRPGEFLVFSIGHRRAGTRIAAMPVTRNLALAG